MKSSMMALAVGVALAGCSTGGDGNVFASRDKTVEYYRVFDIKTDPSNPAVVKAASEGISRHVADATLATPTPSGALQEQPGRFQMADGNTAPGAARGPNCEGATWTAKATPRVNGGDNMNIIACLFPYKNGYHLDMYAVFTEKEGGWLEWPRKFTGKLMGTPETWTDQTMVDVVRSIRDSTGAQVALVEAKPALAGEPWLQMGPSASPTAPAPAGVAGPGGNGGAAGASAAGAAGGINSASGAGSSGTSGTAGSAATTPVPNPANGIAPLPSTAAAASAPASAPASTPAPAPTPAAAPAASATEGTPKTTIATGESDAKQDKTNVK